MNAKRTDVERYGERLIKYRLNVADTRHLISMRYKGRYFDYIMDKGRQVDRNGMPVHSDMVRGRLRPGKYWEEYRASRLNEWH